MLTKGNPALCLRYPEGRQKENWWGMVECLYTAFAAATLRWSLTEGAASHKSETKSAYCESVQDYATRDLLNSILVSEEEHVDWLESQLGLIDRVGIENYQQSMI